MIEPVISFLGAIQFQNYTRARIRGLECAVQSSWWHRRIDLRGSLTWLDPMDIERDVTLPYRPRLTYNVIGTLRLGPSSFQCEYRYASRIDEVQLNPLDPRVSIKLLYLRAQIEFWHFTLQLAVNNATNYHYTQVERRMGEIRNATVGLVMDLGK
jgi:outer membrane cobalamin receptor